nr:glycosyltransferase family 4 protein [Coralloluteibacterium stylophorae]
MDALAAREGGRLRLCALVHHPLALETGVDAAQAAELAARERRALARARAVIATSRTTADALVAQYGVDLARLSVVPPGTERPSRLALREARVGRVRIVAVGSLIPRKGFDVLIAALGLLHPLSWQLRIVGGERDAATAAALRGQVRSLHLDDRVRFVGEVADTAPELADADVFALPSRHEGYGMVFAEAMAHGLPVVACRAGAVPEVVPDTAGLLVPVDDVQALADALRRLIGDAGLRTRLSAGALRAARALPGWTESARVLARALEAA